MRRAALAIVATGAVFGVASAAAWADTLRVTGDDVNLRRGPGLETQIVLQVHAGQEAVELDRDEPWVRVRLPDRDLEGWIYGSLLTPAPETGSGQGGPVTVARPPAFDAATSRSAGPAERAVAAPVDHAAIERLRGSIAYINRRATHMAGAGLFAEVEALGPGKVRVVTTDVWETIPAGGRQSYLNTLYLRWAAVATGGPLRVELVDASGALLMAKSAP